MMACFGVTSKNDQAARATLHNPMAESLATFEDCFCRYSCAGDCYARTLRTELGGHLFHGRLCLMKCTIIQGLLLRKIAHARGVWNSTCEYAAPHLDEVGGMVMR